MNKYITVLDFEEGKVFQYKPLWNYQTDEKLEDYLYNKGHNLTNCEWMIHDDPKVITD